MRCQNIGLVTVIVTGSYEDRPPAGILFLSLSLATMETQVWRVGGQGCSLGFQSVAGGWGEGSEVREGEGQGASSGQGRCLFVDGETVMASTMKHQGRKPLPLVKEGEQSL